MKRMHIHVGVGNLDQSINFYNALFGEQPVKTKADYAKWMLDDPRINFVISTQVGTDIDTACCTPEPQSLQGSDESSEKKAGSCC